MATEINRALMPLTNEHFAAFCLKMVGQPYWYGTCLYKCSSSVLSRKTSQYPSHYGSSRTSRYKQDIAAKKVCADCIGGAKGYAWTNGGVGVLESIGTDKTFASKYGSNGCPDKGANSMFTYAKTKGMGWGKIDTLPEIVGLALHKDGHIGYYIGNGYAVEWKGFAYGCVKTKVAGRGWQYWYKLPFINYESIPTSGPNVPTEPSVRELSYTSGKAMLRGEDVRALQVDLNALGYACGTADGIFGPKTSMAVKAFQRDHGLEVDGVVGKKTRAALEEALKASDPSDGGQDPETQAPSDEHDEGQTPDGTEPGEPVGEDTDSDEGDADEDDEEDYIPPSEGTPLDYGTRLLRYRSGRTMMTGADVAAVQKRLIQLGYNPGKADGIYGPNTAAAVKAFQKAVRIEVDGIVGPVTRAKLAAGREISESDSQSNPSDDGDPDDEEPAPEKRPATGVAIDVSQYQGSIDWTKTARAIDFAILRASVGTNADTKIARNIAGCVQNKVPFGVYHYMKGKTVEETVAEARLIHSICKDSPALYYVADVEYYGADVKNVRALVSAFVAELRRLGVPRVGLYIAHHRYEQYNLNTSEVEFVWIPRYGSNSGKLEKAPAFPCDLHQYASRGKEAGIAGNVDLNRVTGSGRTNAWFRGEESQ